MPLRCLGYGVCFSVFLALLVVGEAEAAMTMMILPPGYRSCARGRQKGISEVVLDDALNGIAPLPRVIELDRSQPEFVSLSRNILQGCLANRKRVAAEKLREHDRLLTEVAAKYGVQKRFLVTFWGSRPTLAVTLAPSTATGAGNPCL